MNLSCIRQPWVRVAAIVVSEITERLSPNIAPQTTAARQMAPGKPVFVLMPIAIGVSAAMVPTEVPIESEMKQEIKNSPATATDGGKIVRLKLTVLSTPPAADTAPEKAPARRKMMHMSMTFSCPMLRVARTSFSPMLCLLFCRNATKKASKKATMAGVR